MVLRREAEQLLSQWAASDRWPITAVVQKRNPAPNLFSQRAHPIRALAEVGGRLKPRLFQLIDVCEDEQSVMAPVWTEETLKGRNGLRTSV